jgi:uncharacterized protein (DUF427 family)
MNDASGAKPRQSGYAKHPGYDVHFEPCPKRVRCIFAGETIADSTRVMRMHETKHLPVYYFPAGDVDMERLQPTAHQTFCPFKGEASYWSVQAGDRVAENAVWSYRTPFDEAAEIKDYLAFYWDRMDSWWEEDEEVFVHARDPRVRIDVLASTRPVEVVLGGRTVARSTEARFLFETGLPTRYYLPSGDVEMDLLTATETRTACPYKGQAAYWSATIDGEVFEDIAWSYPEPIAEAARIKDLVCFFNERVDAVLIDGKAEAKPVTKWSG